MKTLIEKIQQNYPFEHNPDNDNLVLKGVVLKTYVLKVDEGIAEMQVLLQELHENGQVVPDLLRLSVCELEESELLINRIDFFNTSSEFKVYSFLQHFVSTGGI